MANVNIGTEELIPQGGANNAGEKIGRIEGVAKAAQNDTVTVTNASSVKVISIIDDTTGAFETHTVSGNVITLTSATTGAKSLTIIYKN